MYILWIFFLFLQVPFLSVLSFSLSSDNFGRRSGVQSITNLGLFGRKATSSLNLFPDALLDPSQTQSVFEGARWLMDQINQEYRDVLCQMVQKYSNSITTLENIEQIAVKDMGPEGFNVEVIYQEVEHCVAVEVPIAFPHGNCGDVESAASQFNELAEQALDSARDHIEIPSHVLDSIPIMSPELERDAQNLMSMINRNFVPDMIEIAMKNGASKHLLDIRNAQMEGLNQLGFTILLTLLNLEQISVDVKFNRKCESLSDFQAEIGELCEV